MRIGIDVSQTAYENTGVSNYLLELIKSLTTLDKTNEYVFFFSSLRSKVPGKLADNLTKKNVTLKRFFFPLFFLDFFWNRLHIAPVEWLTGPLDVYISSDWVQPPARAFKITILYDLIALKFPNETHNKISFNPLDFTLRPNIVESQKRRLHWVKKECDKIICISESTKDDARKLLKINEEKLKVIYPGISV